MRSIARQGRQSRIMPRSWPDGKLEADQHTASSAGSTRSSRGLLSTCNTSSFRSSTSFHARRNSSRNRRTMRAARRSSISVSGRPQRRLVLAAAAQQTVDHRIEDRRLDVQQQAIVQRRGLQHMEARGRLEAVDELAVGALVDAGEAHVDAASQQGRKGRAEVARQALVQDPQPPQVLRTGAMRALEVVGHGETASGLAGVLGANRRLRRAAIDPSFRIRIPNPQSLTPIPSPARCRTRRTCSWSAR